MKSSCKTTTRAGGAPGRECRRDLRRGAAVLLVLCGLAASGCLPAGLTFLGIELADDGGKEAAPPTVLSVKRDPHEESAPLDDDIVEGEVILIAEIGEGRGDRTWPLEMRALFDERSPLLVDDLRAFDALTGEALDRRRIRAERERTRELRIVWDSRPWISFAPEVRFEVRLEGGAARTSDPFQIDNSSPAELEIKAVGGDGDLPDGTLAGNVLMDFVIHDEDADAKEPPFDDPMFFGYHPEFVVHTLTRSGQDEPILPSFAITEIESGRQVPPGETLAAERAYRLLWDSDETFPDQRRENVRLELRVRDTKPGPPAIVPEGAGSFPVRGMIVENSRPGFLDIFPRVVQPSDESIRLQILGRDFLPGIEIEMVIPASRDGSERRSVLGVVEMLSQVEMEVTLDVRRAEIYGPVDLVLRNPNLKETLVPGIVHFAASRFEFEQSILSFEFENEHIAVGDFYRDDLSVPDEPDLAVAGLETILILRGSGNGVFEPVDSIRAPLIDDGTRPEFVNVVALRPEQLERLNPAERELAQGAFFVTTKREFLVFLRSESSPGEWDITTIASFDESGKRRLHMADLEDDGRLDSVIVAKNDHAVFVIRDVLSCAGSSAGCVLLERNHEDIGKRGVVVDADGQGLANDIAVKSDGEIRFFLDAPHGECEKVTDAFKTSGDSDTGDDAKSVAFADFDDDGYADIAVGRNTDVVVVLSEGEPLVPPDPCAPGRCDECLAWRDRLRPLPEAGSECDFIAAADLDADGDPDVVALFEESKGVGTGLYLNDGQGSFPEYALVPSGQKPTFVVIADLNGDRVEDLVVNAQDSREILLFQGAQGALPLPWFSADIRRCEEPPGSPPSFGSDRILAVLDGSAAEGLRNVPNTHKAIRPAEVTRHVVALLAQESAFAPARAAVIHRGCPGIAVVERSRRGGVVGAAEVGGSLADRWRVVDFWDLSRWLGWGYPVALGRWERGLLVAWHAEDGSAELVSVALEAAVDTAPVPVQRFSGERVVGLQVSEQADGDSPGQIAVLTRGTDGAGGTCYLLVEEDGRYARAHIEPLTDRVDDLVAAPLGGGVTLVAVLSRATPTEAGSVLFVALKDGEVRSRDEVVVEGDPGALTVRSDQAGSRVQVGVTTGTDGRFHLFTGDVTAGPGRPVVFSRAPETFSLVERVRDPLEIPAVLLEDFNRDGLPDLMVIRREVDTIAIYPNTGAPVVGAPFGRAMEIRIERKPYAVVAEDFDADGVRDLLVAEEEWGFLGMANRSE